MSDKPKNRLFKKRPDLSQELDKAQSQLKEHKRALKQTNQALSLLQTIDALALESQASLKSVCQHIAEAIIQTGDFALIGILTRSRRNPEQLTLQGWSSQLTKGHALGLSHPLHLKTEHEWFNQPLSTLIVPFDQLSDKEIADALQTSRAEVDRFRHAVPLQSLYLVKLLARRKLVGVLVVGYHKPAAKLDINDTVLIDRISESIGLALDNKLLLEENQAVLRKLRESNTRLRELDEAKDDFISMASHQLRTPLTSIKGYISMMKEGDAGKVNAQQKQMLEQAFFSSQRMVYIIADLLNVSRIRTGKFIIEQSPVNLKTVVAEEVEQLSEIAKLHKIKLVYKKPKTKVPDLMLDETKTRQIIMNFIDNAIYYTPSGGTITIELLNNPATIELRVTDDGMGVPRSEQHHLFTKFYRASNARTARPDGTGLGLYMAKKVVVAQHGSIIFSSKEGQGSTFGFIFSKHKLAVPPQNPSK